MRRPIGITLMIVGYALGAWVGFVGLSFSGVYLMGYLGTDGKEGREVLVLPWVTLGAVIVCWLLARLGRFLARNPGGRRS
ncbi:hypothetical protein [Arenimonas sp.]|uniref:hypothetical protein n=1 Tax=Arenimonas sp. TaxID=1872635 RepID=UPI0039E447A9